MDIYEAAKRSCAPLSTLRVLEKMGVLKLDKIEGPVSKLAFHMRSNMTFTVPQLLLLLDDPKLIDQLGYESFRYAKRARAQFEELGDVAGSTAPPEVAAEIREAGKGDDAAALVIARWLMDALPAKPVNYQWIAIRLLAPLNEFSRGETLPLLTLAMLGVRRLPEFEGYWRADKAGARKTIKYFQKPKITLDL